MAERLDLKTSPSLSLPNYSIRKSHVRSIPLSQEDDVANVHERSNCNIANLKAKILTNMLVASAVFQSMDKTLERLLKKSTSAYDYIVLLAQSMLPVYTRVYPVFLFYI